MKTLNKFLPLMILILILNILALSSKTVRSLEHIKVSKISFRCDDLLKLQGTKHEIGLVVFTEDNHIYHTSGMLKGKLKWNNFFIDIQGATVKNGKLEILKTDSDMYQSVIPVKFWSKFEPEKVFYDSIVLNYESSLEIFPTKGVSAIPGATIEVGMNIIYDNGTEKKYRSLNSIPEFDRNFEILMRSASYKKSKFTVNEDPLDIPGHRAGIIVELRRDRNIYGIFEITMDYNASYKNYAFGNSGMFGSSGFSGSSGSTGENGRHGQDGEPGNHGYNGSDMDVYVDAYFDTIVNATLLKVRTENLNTGKHNNYLINTKNGEIQIYAYGGSGGSGGNGGSGGSGGKGYDGEYYEEKVKEIIIKKDTAGREIKTEIIKTIIRQRKGGDGGFGGDGGWGGPGGNGGNGGFIIVYHTDAATDFLNMVKVFNSGGSGGWGGNGGSGGAGGNGGYGNPNGRNGLNGRNGADAPSGYSGERGRIEYKQVDEIPWY